MNADVKLIPLDGTPSFWKMSMGDGHEGDKPGHYPQVDLPKKRGAHVLTFDIVGSKDDHVRQRTAIWMWVAIPTGPSRRADSGIGKFPVWKVVDGGQAIDRRRLERPGVGLCNIS